MMETTDFPTLFECPTAPVEACADRLRRAETEEMVLDADAYRTDDVYAVHSQSGEEYVVNARTGECSCPDHYYRGVKCKHYLRAAVESGCAACAGPGFCMAHGA